MPFKIHTNLRRIDLGIFCPEISGLTSVFVQCIFGLLANINMIQTVTLCKRLLRHCEVESGVWWNLKCQLKMMTYLMPTGHTLQCLLKQNSNWLQWEVCWSENGGERKRHRQRHNLKYYSRFSCTSKEPVLFTEKDGKNWDSSAYLELPAIVAHFREYFWWKLAVHWKLQVS